MTMKIILHVLCIAFVIAAGVSANVAHAEDGEVESGAATADTPASPEGRTVGPQNSVAVLRETLVVTATKKAGGEQVQDVPFAIKAYGEQQLTALHVRDLSSLTVNMPNVALDEVGTSKGIANFTIRGLGINSSIPSIDPTVGVFVDGVYLGINAGVVLDNFDLAGIEVARGPQGVLFGRNVTGGAVLLRTGDPQQEFEATGRFALESGLRGTGGNYYAMGTVTGALFGSDTVSGRLAVYYNGDEGWFDRTLPSGGKQTFGDSETFIVRPSIRIQSGSDFDLILKYEHGETTSDGPAAQSHTNGSGVDGQVVNFDRNSFDFSIDEVGNSKIEWNQFTATLNLDVGFGDGTITNIFSYRDFHQEALSDIDATPSLLFHARFGTAQDQISNEIRYSGTFFDALNVVTGVYYFNQEIGYSEDRFLLNNALTQSGGGIQHQETVGVFGHLEYDITDRISIFAGIRYTHEAKRVEIASLSLNVNALCDVLQNECPFDFTDRFTTSNWSPRVGFRADLTDEMRVYGFWARAYRAGGYNFRNAAEDTVNFGPGPFGDERVDNFEIGLKSEPGGIARVNVAAFYNKITNMQREVALASPTSGTLQLIRNTADARLMGFEVEALIEPTDGVIIEASVGYIDGDYTEVLFDLNGDGIVDEGDESLTIPRLAPWTFHVGLIAEQEVGNLGRLTGRISFSHRDASAYSDNNLGQLNAYDRLDASLSLEIFDGSATLTLYGKNLTNDVQFGAEAQLPALLGAEPLGGTFAPLSKGRTFGIEISARLY